MFWRMVRYADGATTVGGTILNTWGNETGNSPGAFVNSFEFVRDGYGDCVTLEAQYVPSQMTQFSNNCMVAFYTSVSSADPTNMSAVFWGRTDSLWFDSATPQTIRFLGGKNLAKLLVLSFPQGTAAQSLPNFLASLYTKVVTDYGSEQYFQISGTSSYYPTSSTQIAIPPGYVGTFYDVMEQVIKFYGAGYSWGIRATGELFVSNSTSTSSLNWFNHRNPDSPVQKENSRVNRVYVVAPTPDLKDFDGYMTADGTGTKFKWEIGNYVQQVNGTGATAPWLPIVAPYESDPYTIASVTGSIDTGEGNLTANPSFENETGGVPNGWTLDAGWARSNAVAISGSWSLAFTGTTGSAVSQRIPCRPNDAVIISAYIRGTTGATGDCYPKIVFWDEANNVVGNYNGTFATATNTWQLISNTYTAPAGAVSFWAEARCDSRTTGTWYVDSLLGYFPTLLAWSNFSNLSDGNASTYAHSPATTPASYISLLRTVDVAQLSKVSVTFATVAPTDLDITIFCQDSWTGRTAEISKTIETEPGLQTQDIYLTPPKLRPSSGLMGVALRWKLPANAPAEFVKVYEVQTYAASSSLESYGQSLMKEPQTASFEAIYRNATVAPTPFVSVTAVPGLASPSTFPSPQWKTAFRNEEWTTRVSIGNRNADPVIRALIQQIEQRDDAVERLALRSF